MADNRYSTAAGRRGYQRPAFFFLPLRTALLQRAVPVQGCTWYLAYGTGGGVFWKFWVVGCPNTPVGVRRFFFCVWVLMGSRQGCIRVGGWICFRFPFHPLFVAVSILRHNMKVLCECGLM